MYELSGGERIKLLLRSGAAKRQQNCRRAGSPQRSCAFASHPRHTALSYRALCTAECNSSRVTNRIRLSQFTPSFFLFISLFLGFLLSHLALILSYSSLRISCFFCSLLHFRSTPSIENEYILLQVERLFLILIKYARFSSHEYSLNHQTVSL